MIEFKNFNRKDTRKVIDFSIRGMSLDRYTKNPLFLRLYARYFWYLEKSSATQIIAAYDQDTLLGVLVADMKDEPKLKSPWYERAYARIVDFILYKLFPAGENVYDQINQQMLDDLKKKYELDGEIRFFAVNPDEKGKGIGTQLLDELKRRESGKRIYLYTDDGCTYQFYDRKGFEKRGDEMISMDFGSGPFDLNCFIYTVLL